MRGISRAGTFGALAVLLLASPLLRAAPADPVADVIDPNDGGDEDAAAAPLAPPAARAPKAKLTVVAPPGGEGVTVVVPTAGGGVVTAVGCRVVEVDGATTLVAAGGGPCASFAPYQPYQPYGPAASCCRHHDPHIPDAVRSGTIVFSAVVFGLGTFYTGILMSAGQADERRNGHIGYVAVSTLIPSIPRVAVGGWMGALSYATARAVSIGIGFSLEHGENAIPVVVFAYILPQILATVDLATTPYRDDELRQDKKRDEARARVTGVGPAPFTDRRGTHGAVLSVGGVF